MKNITKILVVIAVIIIIAGIVMTATKGLNFDLKYRTNESIEFNLGQQFDKNDIKNISNDVFGNQPVIIQSIEVYEDAVKITTTEISKEQKENLVKKVNEKYGTELKADSIEIEKNANIKGITIVEPYIIPVAIVTAVIVLYQMIRFRKLNSLKILLKSLCSIIGSELLLLSIFAIGQIPVGEYITSLILVMYILAIGISNCKFENQLRAKLEELKEE